MRNSLFNRRIPTLLAVVMLIGGIGFASYLANTRPNIIGEASPDERPQNIRLTNITDSALTVTYTTAREVLGTVSFGTGQTLSQTAFDDRDTSQSPKAYVTHSITLRNLSPQTTYSFSVTSGANTFLDNGKPFQVTTGPAITTSPPPKKEVSGTITRDDGTILPNTIIYITSENAQVLSTLSDSKGNYKLSVGSMRTADLQNYKILEDDTQMNLIAATNNATSQASFIMQDSTIPPLTLSQNYDFTLGRTILLPQNASDAGSVQFPVFDVNPVEDIPVSIDTPQKDEKFSDLQPQFEGTAAPNETVEITIQSEEVKATVQATSNGNWTYRPEAPLDPGEHTVTIKTRDARGILRTIRRSFIVLAEGSQFTEPSVSPPQSASPSVSPTRTPSPTLIPTATIAITESTPVPTEIIAIPTSEPSPTLSPRPTIQPTGSETTTTLSIFALAILMLGVILLFLTRGMSL